MLKGPLVNPVSFPLKAHFEGTERMVCCNPVAEDNVSCLRLTPGIPGISKIQFF